MPERPSVNSSIMDLKQSTMSIFPPPLTKHSSITPEWTCTFSFDGHHIFLIWPNSFCNHSWNSSFTLPFKSSNMPGHGVLLATSYLVCDTGITVVDAVQQLGWKVGPSVGQDVLVVCHKYCRSACLERRVLIVSNPIIAERWKWTCKPTRPSREAWTR